jgi:hypothetical protein
MANRHVVCTISGSPTRDLAERPRDGAVIERGGVLGQVRPAPRLALPGKPFEVCGEVDHACSGSGHTPGVAAQRAFEDRS